MDARGDGTPQALRNAALASATQVDRRGLITFNRLGIPAGGWPPGQTNDVFGALLDVIAAEEGHAWVFVIGVVHRAAPTRAAPIPPGEIRDVRVAICFSRQNARTWQVSPAAPKSTERYRSGRVPGDAVARPFFPAPGDRFEFHYAVQDGVLVVVEQRSGTRWEVGSASASGG